VSVRAWFWTLVVVVVFWGAVYLAVSTIHH
jgi:hypothetical protein